MPFDSIAVSTGIAAIPEEVSAQLATRRLEAIEKEEKDAQGRVSVLMSMERKWKDLPAEINEMEEAKGILRKEIETAKAEIRTLSATQEAILTDIVQEEERLRTVTERVSAALNEEKAAMGRLDLLASEMNDAQKRRIEADRTFEAVQKQISDADKEMEAMQRQQEAIETAVAALSQEETSLIRSIGEKNDRLQAIDTRISDEEPNLSTLLEAIEEAKTALTKAEEDRVKAIDAREAEVAAREASLIEREGQISLREAWLGSKTEHLRDVKRSLEEYHGKTINIPI